MILKKGTIGNHFLIALLLIASFCIMYVYFMLPPYWSKLKGAGFDNTQYFGPSIFYMDACIHNRQLPLWNSFILCGVPFAANPQAAVFYPPNLLRSILAYPVKPSTSYLSMVCLIGFHIFLAGLGAFKLARDYQLSVLAAILAAFAYMFSPYLVMRSMEQWVVVATVAWLPLFLLCGRRSIWAPSSKGRIWYIFASAFVMAMMFLAGFIQLVFFSGVVFVLVIFAESFFFRTQSRAQTFSDKHVFKLISKNIIQVFLVATLATLLAAILLVPATELVHISSRLSHVESNTIDDSGYNLSFLFNCLIAYPGKTKVGCRGAGIGVLLLAFLSLAHFRRQTVWMFACLWILLTDMSFGNASCLGWLVNRLDVFHFASPFRIATLAGLPLALMAGFGLDTIIASSGKSRHTILLSIGTIIAGVICWVRLLGWVQENVPIKAQYWILFITGCVVVTIVVMFWLPKGIQGGIVIVALIFLEIFTWNNSYYFEEHISIKENRIPVEMFPAIDTFPLQNVRGRDLYANASLYKLQPIMNGYEPLHPASIWNGVVDAPFLYKKTIPAVDVMGENQRGNQLLKRFFWLSRQYVDSSLPQQDCLYEATTTAFLAQVDPLPIQRVDATRVLHSVSDDVQVTEIARNDSLYNKIVKKQINLVEYALPNFTLDYRHSVLRVSTIVRGRAEIWFTLADPVTGQDDESKHYSIFSSTELPKVFDFPLPDFRCVKAQLRCKFVPGTLFKVQSVSLLQDNADETNRVRIVERCANAVEVEIRDIPDYRLLLLVDTYYPGWKAFLDSRPVTILKADNSFKGVVIPPGSHRVRFEFCPVSFLVGAVISAITFMGVVTFLWRNRDAAVFSC